MSGGSFISFVVIAYNEADNIGRTLGAVTSLAGLGRYEVIVVNDGSRDRTAEVVMEVASRNRNVRLIDLHRNHGRGYARREGIRAAIGDIIATVDADIVLPTDWLVRTEEGLRGHDAVGGTAVPDGDAAYIYMRFRLAPRTVAHTTAVTGSNALYRRQVFDLLGFDPALREGEDVALNHAARRHRLSFATVPGLLAEHIEHKTFGEELRWRFVSGKGATRQLVIYQQVRPPDIATGAFVGAAVAGLSMALRGKRLVGASIPAALVLAVGTQHVRSRFETPWAQWRRVAPAIAIDSVLLTAYFAGRLAGLAGLWRHLSVMTHLRHSSLRAPSGGLGQPVRVSRGCRDGYPAVARRGQGIPEQH
jgi:GT2 family glycosyltransferase